MDGDVGQRCAIPRTCYGQTDARKFAFFPPADVDVDVEERPRWQLLVVFAFVETGHAQQMKDAPQAR